MSDYRERLIDTAARAMAELRVVSGPNTVSRIDIRRAEAVIDALRVSYCGKAMEYPWTQQRDTWYIACLEVPAVQTHDYSSDHEIRHGL